MNFILAVVAYLALMAVLGAGIFFLVTGKPWLFIFGVIGYVLLFSKFGCLPPKTEH